MLQDKIQSAIRILKIAEKQAAVFAEPVEIAYSGGKDSDVLLQLAKMANINFHAYYKNTTIDPPGTIQHVKNNGVTIVKPKKTFFEIVKSKGFPSMFRRFCCAELKEYKILNVCAIGVRAAESVKRSKRYKTFENCRVFSNTQRVKQYFPIFDWKLQDVIDFCNLYNLTLAPHYYNTDGTPDYSRRLGCMGCPLRADRGKADFLNHPALLRALLHAGEKFIHTHTDALRLFDHNIYDAFVCNVFFHSYESFKLATKGGFFGDVDCKEFIYKYFNL